MGRCRFCHAARVALLASTVPSAAMAQQTPDDSPSFFVGSYRQAVDDTFVDLPTLTPNVPLGSISIGGSDDEGGITLSRTYGDASESDGGISFDGTYYTVTVLDIVARFTRSGNNFSPIIAEGSSLVLNGQIFTYKSNSGLIAYFDFRYAKTGYRYSDYNNNLTIHPTSSITSGGLTAVVYPSGASRSYSYTMRAGVEPKQQGANYRFYRLQSIRTSANYHLKFTYAKDTVDGSPWNDPEWFRRTKATLLNARDTNDAQCNDTANDCGIVGRPSITFGSTVTTPDGASPDGTTRYRTTQVTENASAVTITSTGAAPLSFTLTSGKVTSATVGGVKTNYSFADSGGFRTVTRVRPTATETFKFDAGSRFLREYRNATTGATITYTPDTSGRLKEIALPEGNRIAYEYDGAGNIRKTSRFAKSNASTIADIVESATYNTDCTIAFICNRPLTITAANNAVTSYSYDASQTNTVIVTVRQPAPRANAVAPEARLTFSKLGDGRFALTQSSSCRTLSSCAGTSDEVRTTLAYGSMAENNVQPKTVTRLVGDNSSVLPSALSYDVIGNVVAVDGPLSGSADTTSYSYDSARRTTRVVSPDPDGPETTDGKGKLLRRAQATVYKAGGLIENVSIGTMDAAGTAFTALQTVSITYDALYRKAADAYAGGGTTYATTHYGYNAATGQLECVTQRMNLTAWVAGSAVCTPEKNGPYGPDRVVRTTYDVANRTVTTVSGYGTTTTAEEKRSYSLNGQLKTVTDARGNMTSYGYDGLDRPTTTTYPGGSFEELGYWPGTRNVSSRRRRDGSSIAYHYDALNRLTEKRPPSGTRPVFYDYDLAGNLTAARFDATSGADAVTAQYDALGRVTSATTAMGGTSRTLTYGYDTGGKWTSITHPGGSTLYTHYDTVGEATCVSTGPDCAATSLVGLAYDDLARPRLVIHGSSSTGYGFNAGSQLTGLTQGFAGNSGNLTTGLKYNGVGQIRERTLGNTEFAASNAVNVDRSYGDANALNQYQSVASLTFGYDARGNLTSDGINTYSYDAENRLTGTSRGQAATLAYDPLGRLWQVASGGRTTQFLTDGDHVVAEYDAAGTVQRRYAWGPGSDMPLFQDEGGALNCTGTRFLHPDERGSIIATADCQGNRQRINSYDEFGIPGTANWGRFQYTGQAWLAELGMYYYKARMYSPTLGRFMQTDPIGYGDGMNMYAYVGGDSVNRIDPSGMLSVVCGYSSGGIVYADNGQIFDGRSFSCSYLPDPFDFDSPLRISPPERGGSSDNSPQLKVTEPQKTQVIRVNCKSTAREFAEFGSRLELTAGGSALLFGALGAEPIAGILGGAAAAGDGIKFVAGGYIYLTEGDAGPLTSSVIGSAFGVLGGAGVKLFGGRSFSPFSGTRVTIRPSATASEAGEYAGDKAANAVPVDQGC